MNLSSKLKPFVESSKFQNFIIGLILFNAVTLGLETTDFGKQHIGVLQKVDFVILSIFTVELALKLIVYRKSFFSGGWNWFDLIIVTISWVPTSGALSVLRAFRILRVLRLFSVVPQMRRVIGALGHSLPGMASVVGVLAIIFYVSAVLVTKLFGTHEDPNMQEWFGNIGDSAYTLFQVMTLESWSMGIVRPTMEIFPWSWVFFVPLSLSPALLCSICLLVSLWMHASDARRRREIKACTCNKRRFSGAASANRSTNKISAGTT